MPMVDKVVQLKVPGQILMKALENSVSQFPKLDGRFMGVSGLNFKWDSSREPGQRIVSVQMWKDSAELDPSKIYNITLKYFIAVGKDGFTCFQDPSVEMLTNLESARSIQDIVFGALEQLGAQESDIETFNDIPKFVKQKTVGE